MEDLTCLEGKGMEEIGNGFIHTHIYTLLGLQSLRKLESLSLAHNFLSYEAFHRDGPISFLVSLKKLDLGYNLLTTVPPVVFSLSK